ncbi:hypothetical protein Acr_15g0017370 [Actinidia rufa]|uniref:F-box domain-containing protein n=1 Tax=Actinidia rufa TaxID=165716 RepID=A0A7J0FWR0_9ERIC|nr:hypothetical protein Acr_15g0017370 [Actinidia rufa]
MDFPAITGSDNESCDPDRHRKRRNTDQSPVYEPTSVDRISDLHDSLLVHILSLLPIEDAVKTQVLSKRWQHLFTHIPSLVFRYVYRDSYHSDDEYDESDPMRDFVTFVEKTLTLCNCSKLKKLGVYFEYDSDYVCNVDLWACIAAGKGTEELHLEFDSEEDFFDESDRYELPQLLYSNSSFRELRFSRCHVVPKGVVAWNSLKKLSIGYVKLSDDKLVLRDIWEDIWEDTLSDEEQIDNSDLEISGPNLQSLEILGHLKSCRVGDVSSLVDATLNCDLLNLIIDDDESVLNMLKGLLKSLAHVKNITLGKWVMQVLSMMEAQGLRSPLLECECLTLDTDIQKAVLPGIANLLESSPNLKTLVITLSSSGYRQYFWPIVTELLNYDEKHYWTSQKRTFKCLMLHLTEVKFSGVSWNYLDLYFSFVQFLLKNARVLQKMVIDAPREDGRNPTEVSLKLLSFPRSSPNVVVMCSERNG